MSDSNTTINNVSSNVSVNNQQKGNETTMQENQTNQAVSTTATPEPAKKGKKGPQTRLEQLQDPEFKASGFLLAKWFNAQAAKDKNDLVDSRALIVARVDCPVEIFEAVGKKRSEVERKALLQAMAACGHKPQTDFLLGFVRKDDETGNVIESGMTYLVTYGSAKTIESIVSSDKFKLELLPRLFDNNVWTDEKRVTEANELADKLGNIIQDTVTKDITIVGEVLKLVMQPSIQVVAKSVPSVQKLLGNLFGVIKTSIAQVETVVLPQEPESEPDATNEPTSGNEPFEVPADATNEPTSEPSDEELERLTNPQE